MSELSLVEAIIQVLETEMPEWTDVLGPTSTLDCVQAAVASETATISSPSGGADLDLTIALEQVMDMAQYLAAAITLIGGASAVRRRLKAARTTPGELAREASEQLAGARGAAKEEVELAKEKLKYIEQLIENLNEPGA